MRKIKAESYFRAVSDMPDIAEWVIAHHDPAGKIDWGFFTHWTDEPDGHHSRHHWTPIGSFEGARTFTREEAELELALLRVCVPDSYLYLVPAPATR